MPPQVGQPYMPGNWFSIGDPEAAPGTDAYQGVFVIEPAGAQPSAYIIDHTLPFKIKAYFKFVGVFFAVPAAFTVNFYITDLTGAMVTGAAIPSTASTDPETPPDGAVAPPPGHSVWWFSYEVDIPAGLNPDTIYRISVDGDDAATFFAFHDLTIIKTTAP